tara:strand:+ start:476 stop:691 length:216 start_codon:yes stop_codon:yes gene_type:complete
MKNLFERLNDECRKNILNQEEEYPYTIKPLIKKLKESWGITSLTLEEINSIIDRNPTSVTEINQIYNMFPN